MTLADLCILLAVACVLLVILAGVLVWVCLRQRRWLRWLEADVQGWCELTSRYWLRAIRAEEQYQLLLDRIEPRPFSRN